MLRIMMKPQGPGQQPPVPGGPQPSAPPIPQPGLPPTPPDADDQDQDSGQCQTTQQIAGYMGADQGPFECGRCQHFQGPSSCDIVAGKIEEDGCCNLFTPGGNDPDADQEDDEAAGPPDVASLLKGQ